MDRQVFYAISNRTSEIKKSFDDSHHKLYRFVGLDLPEGLENSNSTIIETSSSDEEHDYSIMEDCRGNQSIRWDFNHENKIIIHLLSFWLTSLEFFNLSNCFIKTILFYRLSPDQEGNLDDSIVCNQIAVNKKGQVLQEIISLHQSFTRRRSRSSIKSETSILTRSSYRDSPIPPEGKGFSKISDMKFLI